MNKTLYQMDNFPLGITAKVILNSKGMFVTISGYDGKMISYRLAKSIDEVLARLDGVEQRQTSGRMSLRKRNRKR